MVSVPFGNNSTNAHRAFCGYTALQQHMMHMLAEVFKTPWQFRRPVVSIRKGAVTLYVPVRQRNIENRGHDAMSTCVICKERRGVGREVGGGSRRGRQRRSGGGAGASNGGPPMPPAAIQRTCRWAGAPPRAGAERRGPACCATLPTSFFADAFAASFATATATNYRTCQ